MKIYTSQSPQFGRELLILNEKVTFDRFGCAEVNSELGAKLTMSYPEWYSSKKFEFKEELQIAENSVKELEDKSGEINSLKEDIERLKRIDSQRKDEIISKNLEIKDLQKALSSESAEKLKLAEELKIVKENSEREKDILKTKLELVDMKSDELKQTAISLKIDEKVLSGLKKPDIIEAIVKKTYNIE